MTMSSTLAAITGAVDAVAGMILMVVSAAATLTSVAGSCSSGGGSDTGKHRVCRNILLEWFKLAIFAYKPKAP